MAHLVLPVTQADPSQNQKSHFSQTLQQTTEIKMNKPITYLLGFLIFIGCGAFVYGIAQACIESWPQDGNNYEIPAFLSSTVQA